MIAGIVGSMTNTAFFVLSGIYFFFEKASVVEFNIS